ncbi:prepilin-type N-terminal cleavage/methylation domain-containing protein [Candidatus Gottesmanbacteria bacterium]|nr:prepilin-type N-terminal cleavage/methylation domain-containing protein [Candidatus Gottesmanbacteria bacterium]
MQSDQKGFTISELSLTIGIFAILFAIGSIILLRAQPTTALITTVDSFVADTKQQQIKAMSGFTGNGATDDSFSIFIAQNSYALFRGTAYNAQDTENNQIQFDASLLASTTFPNSILSFHKGDGEIVGFQSGLDTVTFQHTTTGGQKTIKFNRYGTIISIQ